MREEAYAAGAVAPWRNGLQVGGLVAAATAASTQDAWSTLALGAAGALLAALGSQARATLREYEARGETPAFWRGVLLQAASMLGCLAIALPAHAQELPCGDGQPVSYLLRWRAPESGGEVTHYRVYRAATSEGYLEDQFVELELQSTPGAILSQRVEGWDPRVPTYVVMTARGPGGESLTHSNELLVPALERACEPAGRVILLEVTIPEQGEPRVRVVP